MDERIGPYRLLHKLGEGGMGVVYAAHDERLDRPVALKWMRDAFIDPKARERFMREARAAATLSHPNICQVYALDEHEGRPYVAMERLEGRTLAERLRAGPLDPGERRTIALGVASALSALHARGIVHRDLKPSNVFLAADGPKVLDFGLARDLRDGAEEALTRTGAWVGTPQYMAPEQAVGGPADSRSDVFAAGLMLYEMLARRPAFSGDSTVSLLYAIANAEAPPLPAAAASDPCAAVLNVALAKEPGRRYPDGVALLSALQAAYDAASRVAPAPPAARAPSDPMTPSGAGNRPLTRLLALPLRPLRPDPETDFLAFSLPDAVAAALGGLDALLVRPTSAAAAFATHPLDLERIAREANVDVVLTGTLLRAGERVRVNVQLLEAPSGLLVVSHTCEGTLEDLFQLQDDLARHVVEALRLPLTTREHRLLGHDVPAHPRAYAAYLRANQLMHRTEGWAEARTLFEEAVGLDPEYAPAWARLGRVNRVLAKYADESDSAKGYALAAEAFQRALALNPDLPAAHHFVTYLEVETGRAREAMERLLDRLRVRRNDPELYAGLVIACRYAGLLDESVRAYETARRLDPFVHTSVSYTFLSRGDFDRAVANDFDPDRFVTAHVLALTGREAEAIEIYRLGYASATRRGVRALIGTYAAAMERDPVRTAEAAEALSRSAFRDPEGFFLAARSLVFGGCIELALPMLRRALDEGFACPSFMRSDPWLAPLRGHPEFEAIVERAEGVARRMREAFVAAGGDALLPPR